MIKFRFSMSNIWKECFVQIFNNNRKVRKEWRKVRKENATKTQRNTKLDN